MPIHDDSVSLPALGIIGFGAFGRLMAEHLRPYFHLRAYDPNQRRGRTGGVTCTSLAATARCPVVVFATPVDRLEEAAALAAPHMVPGSLVLDVGSVKMVPVEIMRRVLPPHIDIVATHPLFGPQSARRGIGGLKIAVCPIRGKRGGAVAAFLRRALRLHVVMTTPEAHDREAASVQGLTHIIAKVLTQMDPLPTVMTTRSFELLLQGVDMVRHDAPGVFRAIEHFNPYSRDVRRRFFDLAAALDRELGEPPAEPCRQAASQEAARKDAAMP